VHGLNTQAELYDAADSLAAAAGDYRWAAHCSDDPARSDGLLADARALDDAALLLEMRAETHG
jgi:hypothetical protein